MPKTKSNRREFLQLAKTYRPGKDEIAGWFLSEKLDGTRCFWDGGITRGMPTRDVPWASVTDPKTGKDKAKVKPVATGLWSRYGNPIIAPDSFLNLLPCVPLDGELWAGRGSFQLGRSICGGDSPDPRFDQIEYAVYGTPPLTRVFGTGEIKNSNFHADLSMELVMDWVAERVAKTGRELYMLDPVANFDAEMLALRENLGTDRIYMHKQIKLSQHEEIAQQELETHLNRVIELGGEGVMLRAPEAQWTPKRVGSLLKYKPFDDDEGTLVGFTSGRETDKGSKHLGKIGALILDYNGQRLELSGLTDEEREFANPTAQEHARCYPGKDMGPDTKAKHFTVGQKITFIYRELSDDGIPKEARYLRPREDEE